MKDEIEWNLNLYNSIKGKKTKLQRLGTEMNFDEKQLIWQLAHAGERNWGEIQTTIDTSPETLGIHAPHQVEDNIPENHFKCRLVIFGRRMKPHVPP